MCCLVALSTFNYADNEPIRNIDLHGLQAYDAIGAFQDGLANGSQAALEAAPEIVAETTVLAAEIAVAIGPMKEPAPKR